MLSCLFFSCICSLYWKLLGVYTLGLRVHTITTACITASLGMRSARGGIWTVHPCFVLFYWHWHHHLQHLQVDPGWSVGPEAPWAAQPLQSRLHNYENKFLYLLEVPCLIHQGYIKLFIHLEMLTTLNCVAQNLLIFLTTFSLYFPLCSCLNPRDWVS